MKKTTKPTFIGNIDLENERDFQAIYSSQLYGTFFMIYAKFKSKSSTKYELENIELKLLNFKGLLNLGLTRARFVQIKDADEKVTGGKIIIEVQALHTNTYLKSVDNVNGNSFSVNDFINVDRRVKMMDPNNEKSNVFDEEFLYREGFRRNPSAPGDLTTVQTESFNKTPFPHGDYSQDEVTVVAFTGFLCPRSQNKIIR